jgi:hypothetical protein
MEKMENKERFPLSHGTATAICFVFNHDICCTWNLNVPSYIWERPASCQNRQLPGRRHITLITTITD